MSIAIQGIKKLVGIGRSVAAHRLLLTKSYSLYLPDYLDVKKSKIPVYPCLNIQIKSFAYPVLENYQKFIDNLVENLGIEVDNSWAFPPKCYKIHRYKPNSTAIVATYELKEYQRHIQIEVSATQYPIVLRLLEASLPEGVTLTIENFDPEFESKRYVPDTTLLTLKGELQSMQKK